MCCAYARVHAAISHITHPHSAASTLGRLRVAYSLALQRKQRVKVFLTTLGGGAFGNRHAWITDAVTLALAALRDAPLDVVMVHYGSSLKSDWKSIVAPSPSQPPAAARSSAEVPAEPAEVQREVFTSSDSSGRVHGFSKA